MHQDIVCWLNGDYAQNVCGNGKYGTAKKWTCNDQDFTQQGLHACGRGGINESEAKIGYYPNGKTGGSLKFAYWIKYEREAEMNKCHELKRLDWNPEGYNLNQIYAKPKKRVACGYILEVPYGMDLVIKFNSKTRLPTKEIKQGTGHYRPKRYDCKGSDRVAVRDYYSKKLIRYKCGSRSFQDPDFAFLNTGAHKVIVNIITNSRWQAESVMADFWGVEKGTSVGDIQENHSADDLRMLE